MANLAHRLLRHGSALVRRLDRRQPALLRWVPAGIKRRLVRTTFQLLARLLPPVVGVGGVRLAAPRSHLMGYVLSPHEPDTVALVRRWLRPGDTAVDVGANIGYLSLQMARSVGDRGIVYSLEPDPSNLTWLLRNVAINDSRQVRVLPVAAGESPRLRPLHLGGSTRNSFYPDGDETTPVLHVSQVRLDDVVSGPVDLVKIDVEGAEMEVLRGMEHLLRDSPRLCLVVEYNPARLEAAGESPAALPDHLRSRGLEVARLGAGGEPHPFDPGRVPERGYLNLCARRPGVPLPEAR